MKSAAEFFKYSAATLLGLGLITSPAHATVLVSPTADANTLADTILGSGITITKTTYNGASNASGTFSGGSSAGISINNGIILTSGSAANAVGPNKLDNTSTNNGTPGDTQLDPLTNGNSTNDAASLVIDFTTTGGDLFFNYVFASEEYNEFVNSQYNDVFGFFLDGENIALIPGTTTPVAINNVNGGDPFGTNATNSTLYNNNSLSDPGPASFDIEYNGFTKVFQAKKLALSPGTHKIKLAIADAGDSTLDSAVFIQGGSFADTPVPPTPGEPVPPTTEVPFEFSPGLGLLALGAWGAKAQLTSLLRKRKSSRSGFSV